MKRVMKKLLVVLLAISIVEAPLGDAGLALTGQKAVKKVQAATLTEENLGHQDDTGYGTEQKPYTIRNKAQLYKLYKLIEADTRNVDSVPYSHCYYQLTADIVWNEGTARADGTFAGNAAPDVWPAIKEFHGSFDGNGHVISGLYLTKESKALVPGEQQVTGIGLFGTAINAVIKDLVIENSVIKLDGGTVFYNAIGFILGQGEKGQIVSAGNATKLSGCSVGNDCFIVADSMAFDPSNTTATTYVGVNEGINAGEDYSMYRYETTGGLGGLVGMLSGGSIEDCSNGSSVVCQNIRLVGGIAGYIEGANIIDCSNTGSVKGSQSVGGITGMANGTLSKVSGCTNTGNVAGMEWTDAFCHAKFPGTFSGSVNIMAGDYVGGICGQSTSMITGCSNGIRGEVRGTANVGGIVGHSLMGIESSMNHGAVAAFPWTAAWHATVENNMSGILGGSKIFVTGCNAGGIAGSVGEENTTAAGRLNNQIVNCGNTASVAVEGDGTQANSYVGGILGRKYRADGGSADHDIMGCYTAGTASTSHTAFSTQEDITYQNSYYLSEEIDAVEEKSLKQFTSGEVAYLLNDGWKSIYKPEKAVWKQVLAKSGLQNTEGTYPVSNGEQNDAYKVIQIRFTAAEGTGTVDYSSYTQYINEGGKVVFDSVFPKITGKVYEFADKNGTKVKDDDTFREDTVLYVTLKEKKTEPSPTPKETPKTEPKDTPVPEPKETPVPQETGTPLPTNSPDGQGTGIQDDGNVTVGDQEYSVEAGGYAVLKDISGPSQEKVQVPSTITVAGKEYPVKKIGAKTFYKNTEIKEVEIGEGVEEIGQDTFHGCNNLKTVTFPSSIKKLGTNAFASCTKLKKVTLPGGVTSIGTRAFYNCRGLKTLKIKADKSSANTKTFSKGTPEDMVSLWQEEQTYKTAVNTTLDIGKEAMAKCVKLQSVIIQNHVRRIGNATFLSCKRLAKITVKSMHLQYVGDRALKGVSDCRITVPTVKIKPYKKLFKNKGQGKKVVVAKA